MIFFVVFYTLSTSTGIHSNTVTSPQIRTVRHKRQNPRETNSFDQRRILKILDVATKTSETRLIPHRVEYQNIFHPYFQQQNKYKQTEPLKSYVIYDEYPLKIFKEWKAYPPAEIPASAPQNYLELVRQQHLDFPPNYYFQNDQQTLKSPKPTLAYSSVYSNIIKVFDNSLEDLDRNRFYGEKYVKPFEGDVWKSQYPVESESAYPRRQLYQNLKLPNNFPKIFSPNEKFHFPSFDDKVQQPQFFYLQGFRDANRVYNKEFPRHPDEVEIIPEVAFKQKNQKNTFLCSFIRVNQRQFPENGSPCARSDDDLPLTSPEYPDYSSLSNDKIPLEHRRQYFHMKRIKRGGLNESNERRQKRDAGFGYGYSGWASPFGYDHGYDGYLSSNYPSRGGYRNNYSSSYYSNRNSNRGYRGKYYSNDYDDDYQNTDDSNSRGLTSYLTNGGRRYKNRKNNSNTDDEEETEDSDNNSNNHQEDSDEETERMNNNRRDTNDRRNNDDSRDRRRNNSYNNNNNNNNNNYNDEEDNRENRRNHNRNNSRRYNNNNNNNNNSSNNSNRRNNDRNDYNNSRNRYYGNSNGYNNAYGSGYGSYGSNYGGNYGSGGYGSGYGSNGGYGYGSYGNGFGSF